MRSWTTTSLVVLLFGLPLQLFAQTGAEQKADPTLPAPGSRGNAENVTFIGKADAKGNPVRLAKATGHVSNYDESKVGEYKLPNPLVMNDGRPVTSADMWFKERRPEILKFYQTEFYGRIPENTPKVKWEVTETDDKARDGTAIMKRVVGQMGDKPDAPKMTMTMFLPTNATGPVPMILAINFGFGGGRGAVPARPIAGAGGAAAPARPADQAKAPAQAEGAKSENRPRPANDAESVGEAIRRGWGYAALNYSEIQPDRAGAWSQGVIGTTLKEGQAAPAADEWGTISAWAWGISRAIDYLETDKAVNAKQIAITGTSRLGKTVLWAGALDPRVAAVFSVVSGEMGAALIRRDWGETLDDMAQNFGYQFAGNLKNWAGKWNELPVDQHMLIALCAPRPVYVNGGISDQWSDPKGEGLAVIAAGPVYKLLGGKDLGVNEVPPLDQPVITGDLGFQYHSGGHMAVASDWKAFLDFAERHFKNPRNDQRLIDSARAQILIFDRVCPLFEVHVGRMPITLDELVSPPNNPAEQQKWGGPYIIKLPLDPWGNAYQCFGDGTQKPLIWSFGPDGKSGTADDIVVDRAKGKE